MKEKVKKVLLYILKVIKYIFILYKIIQNIIDFLESEDVENEKNNL